MSSPQQVPNGGILRTHQGRTSMNARGESPQRTDMNNHVMAQFNSQINNIDINDLPPPPPVPQVKFYSPLKLLCRFINFIVFFQITVSDVATELQYQ